MFFSGFWHICNFFVFLCVWRYFVKWRSRGGKDPLGKISILGCTWHITGLRIAYFSCFIISYWKLVKNHNTIAVFCELIELSTVEHISGFLLLFWVDFIIIGRDNFKPIWQHWGLVCLTVCGTIHVIAMASCSAGMAGLQLGLETKHF